MASVTTLADWPKTMKIREAFTGSAQVIIFNGVRFERLREESPQEIQIKRRNNRLPNGNNQATAIDLD